MQPVLSIIVPIYKVEKYLNKCVDSILNQTFSDFELILVDDGSPDACPRICDEYALSDRRVKVLHKPNGGLISARKEGAKVAQGKYIGFVDGDDWINLNMYKSLCEPALEYEVDIVICDILLAYENKEIKYKQSIKPGFYDKSSLMRRVYPSMLYSGEFFKFGLIPTLCNKIIKRELLVNNLQNIDENIRIGEDAACSYPCLIDAKQIYVLDNMHFYHYRQIVSSMTHTYDEKFLERVLLLYQYLEKNTANNNITEMTYQLYYYLTYLVINSMSNEFQYNNEKKIREKYSFLKVLCSNKDITTAISAISLKELTFKWKIQIWLLRTKWMKTLLLLLLLHNWLKKLIRKCLD